MMTKILSLTAALATLFLTGCVNHSLRMAPHKTARIGVMSIMGNANVVKSSTPSNPQGYLRPHSQVLSHFNLDTRITQDITNALHRNGYTHITPITLKPNQNPVTVASGHKNCDLVVVISPDEGTSPTNASDLLYGYGPYYDQTSNQRQTLGYANYDVSVYHAKDLKLLASQFYTESTPLKNGQTLTHWLDTTVAPAIAKQASQIIRA